MTQEAPGAVTTRCPDCGEETLHTVLRGKVGSRGEYKTLDATVQCTECERVHQAIVLSAKDIELPVVVSLGAQSRRTRIELPGDEDVSIGEGLIVDGVNCVVTGIEDKENRWVDDATMKDVRTLWVKEFEEVPVHFTINMGKKTISKTMPATPETEFSVGEEYVFGRLRITVHAIKTEDRLLKRGSAEAAEIRRIFGTPTQLARKAHRPDKRSRMETRGVDFGERE